METEQEFIAQVVEDFGWPEEEARVVSFFYSLMFPGCSWQQRWEEFCTVEETIKE